MSTQSEKIKHAIGTVLATYGIVDNELELMSAESAGAVLLLLEEEIEKAKMEERERIIEIIKEELRNIGSMFTKNILSGVITSIKTVEKGKK